MHPEPAHRLPAVPALTAYCKILRGLTDLNIVAADIMEVAPAYDHAGITSLAAATAAVELLYLRAARLRQ